MVKGERVKGDSQEEKDCLQLIHDIDRIGGHVKGSITSKKYMKNEIWSLISFQGAPSWYMYYCLQQITNTLSLCIMLTQKRGLHLFFKANLKKRASLLTILLLVLNLFFSFYDSGFH